MRARESVVWSAFDDAPMDRWGWSLSPASFESSGVVGQHLGSPGNRLGYLPAHSVSGHHTQLRSSDVARSVSWMGRGFGGGLGSYTLFDLQHDW